MFTPENAPPLARQNLKDFAQACKNDLVFTLRLRPAIQWKHNQARPYADVLTGIVGEHPIYHLPQYKSSARLETSSSVQATANVMAGEPLDSPIIGPMLVAGNVAGRAPMPLSANLMAVYDECLVNWRALEKSQDASLSIAGAGILVFLEDLRERSAPDNHFIALAHLSEMAVSRTLAQTTS